MRSPLPLALLSALLPVLLAAPLSALTAPFPPSFAPQDPENASVAAAAPGSSAERAIAAQVDEERGVARVRALCAFGARMGGTASGDAAALYRASAFLEAGLDVEIVLDSEKWAHQEDAWSVRVVGDGVSIELESPWPYGFSPAGAGRAPLALEAADGVALLAERSPGGRRGRRGGDQDEERAPTPAVVLVDGAATSDGAYPKVSHLRAGPDNPYPVFGISKPEGEALRARLAQGAQLAVDWSLDARIERGRPRTVIATLEAREGAKPGYFLFCAHGDSDAGGPGADDNASGESILIEIATAWSAAIASGAAPPPAREVRFAIWGSEIHSTRDFLEAHMLADGPILGVINYDQAGFGSGADQLNVEPDDVPANVALVRTALAVLDEFGGTPGFPARWATNKSLGGTDSYVFSGSEHFQENALPAVTLFTSAWDTPEHHPRTEGMPGESWSDSDTVYVDYDVYYHSAGDTPENTTDKEPWNIAWCARVGALTASRWLERLDRGQ